MPEESKPVDPFKERVEAGPKERAQGRVEADLAPDVMATMNRPLPEVSEEEYQQEMCRLDNLDGSRAERLQLRSIAEQLIYQDEKGNDKINYPALAEACHVHFRTVVYKRVIYIYKEGIYIEDEGQIAKYIYDLFDAIHSWRGPLKRTVDETIHKLKSINLFLNYPFDLETDKICVADGVIKFNWETSTIELIPFSHEYRFRKKIPINWNTTITPEEEEKVMEYLLMLVKKPNEETPRFNEAMSIIQIGAVVMLQSMGIPLKVIYFLIGDPDSGKSTILEDLLRDRIFGQLNCAALNIKELTVGQFDASSLVGKFVNICDDLPVDQSKWDMQRLKGLSGGSAFKAEEKYAKSFQHKNNALMIFSSNEPMRIDPDAVKDQTLWKRMCCIQFVNKFKRDPSFITRTFTPRFCEIMLKLMAYDTFEIKKNPETLLIIQEENKTYDEWHREADPIYDFFLDYLEADPSGELITDYIYIGYAIQDAQKKGKTIYDWERNPKHHTMIGFSRALTRIAKTKGIQLDIKRSNKQAVIHSTPHEVVDAYDTNPQSSGHGPRVQQTKRPNIIVGLRWKKDDDGLYMVDEKVDSENRRALIEIKGEHSMLVM